MPANHPPPQDNPASEPQDNVVCWEDIGPQTRRLVFSLIVRELTALQHEMEVEQYAIQCAQGAEGVGSLMFRLSSLATAQAALVAARTYLDAAGPRAVDTGARAKVGLEALARDMDTLTHEEIKSRITRLLEALG